MRLEYRGDLVCIFQTDLSPDTSPSFWPYNKMLLPAFWGIVFFFFDWQGLYVRVSNDFMNLGNILPIANIKKDIASSSHDFDMPWRLACYVMFWKKNDRQLADCHNSGQLAGPFSLIQWDTKSMQRHTWQPEILWRSVYSLCALLLMWLQETVSIW